MVALRALFHFDTLFLLVGGLIDSASTGFALLYPSNTHENHTVNAIIGCHETVRTQINEVESIHQFLSCEFGPKMVQICQAKLPVY